MKTRISYTHECVQGWLADGLVKDYEVIRQGTNEEVVLIFDDANKKVMDTFVYVDEDGNPVCLTGRIYLSFEDFKSGDFYSEASYDPDNVAEFIADFKETN